MSLVVRGKYVVARYGLVIAVLFALLGVLALGGAYAEYTNPPTREVTETVSEQRYGTGLDTSAVASGETGLYAEGERLENLPVYLYNTSRDVTLTARTTVPDDTRVTVGQRLVLRHVATRDDEVFWQDRRVLAADRGPATDGSASVSATVNASAVRETVRERRRAIGAVGTFRTELRYEVTYRTDGTNGTLTATSGVVLTDRAYWIDGDLAANRTHEETRTRTVTDPPNLARTGLYGALGLGFLLFAVGVAALARREFDLDRIAVELTRSRYDEWISDGEIPTTSEKEYIRIDTLEDLVDIAIDSKKRVIYDDTYESYGVVDSDIVYYFTEGDDEFGHWLDI